MISITDNVRIAGDICASGGDPLPHIKDAMGSLGAHLNRRNQRGGRPAQRINPTASDLINHVKDLPNIGAGVAAIERLIFDGQIN